MFIIELLFKDPISYFIIMLSVIFGLTVHEYFHAWVAYMLGDDTAKLDGRLTVNPLAHFDPILTSMIFVFGLGAAKPVPINPYRFKNVRQGTLLVSLAGIAANLVSAIIFSIIYKALINNGNLASTNLIFVFLKTLVFYNLVLMVFNLIPLPPLDGSKVLLMIASDSYEKVYNYFVQNQMISIIVAIMLFMYLGSILANFLYVLLLY